MSYVRRFVLPAACGAALGLCSLSARPALGAVQVTQNFTTNPANWVREGDANGGAAGQNFGFQNADLTGTTPNPPGGTATGAGEAGGVISPMSKASYGDNLVGGVGGATPLTMNDPLTASGVFRVASTNQETMFGWFNSAGNANTTGLRSHLLGFRQIGRAAPFQSIHVVGENATGAAFDTVAFDGDNTSATRVQQDNTYPFTLTYNPTGGATGNGAMTLFIGGVSSNDGTPADNTFTYDLSAGDRAAMTGITFNRFGMTESVYKPDGGGPETVYFDDLTYTSNVSVPEPAAAGLLAGAGLLGTLRRRRRQK